MPLVCNQTSRNLKKEVITYITEERKAVDKKSHHAEDILSGNFSAYACQER